MTDTERFKAAFISLLGDYTYSYAFDDDIVTFCQLCPLRKNLSGECIKNLNNDYRKNTCAEEIFKHYLEEVDA